jgi:hypothetical protein
MHCMLFVVEVSGVVERVSVDLDVLHKYGEKPIAPVTNYRFGKCCA